MKSRTFLVAAALWTALSSVSGAYLYKGRPECPDYNEGNTWAKYINGNYTSSGYAYFSIRFDRTNRNIGDIRRRDCYTLYYQKSGHRWTMSGHAVSIGGSTVNTRPGPSPLAYKMNVWGITMTFDEALAVRHPTLGRVGTLVCDIGSSC